MPIPLEFSLRSGKGLNAEENHQNKEFHGDIFIFTTTYDPEGEGGNQMRTGALVATPPYTPTSTYASWPVSRDFQAFVL